MMRRLKSDKEVNPRQRRSDINSAEISTDVSDNEKTPRKSSLQMLGKRLI